MNDQFLMLKEIKITIEYLMIKILPGQILLLVLCGMSIKEIKEYMLLCLESETSIPRRKEILNDKLLELNNKKKEIDDSINYIYKKQNFHDCVLTGKTKYYSNLINTNSN